MTEQRTVSEVVAQAQAAWAELLAELHHLDDLDEARELITELGNLVLGLAEIAEDLVKKSDLLEEALFRERKYLADAIDRGDFVDFQD